jgi:hypothetical protein
MAEFRVVVDGVELSDDLRKEINASIQRAVLPYLADLGIDGDRPVVAIPDRRKWRGIWLGLIEREIPEFEEQFGR